MPVKILVATRGLPVILSIKRSDLSGTEIRKLKRELKNISAAIADFERLEAAAPSPKPMPMGNVKSGILFQMIRKKANLANGASAQRHARTILSGTAEEGNSPRHRGTSACVREVQRTSRRGGITHIVDQGWE